MAGWQEELCTGLLVRGTRRREGETIHISGPCTPTAPQEYGVDTVPLHEHCGAWLARAGLDIDRPLEWKNTGVLAAWVQAFVDNRQARPFVGHAAAYWSNETTAHLEVLDTVPGTPDTVTAQLAHRLTHLLADLGAQVIETPHQHQCLADLGYGTHPRRDGLVLEVTTMG
ncbi:hypothetical protein RR21198_3533 [Rhodococcus rhodochrous ATCC 21198]|uniref:Uncharacterized protein n=2 Tax=Nocardiaceae TaxID=85025 RepID=A0A098BLI2_9NOCA|nr:hypothetical protein RR21198_3533 [Rhodococcus rhodochrous ATCC 21198]CDZ89583.1 conserved hypothetical protein [Rhodococcus ruber]